MRLASSKIEPTFIFPPCVCAATRHLSSIHADSAASSRRALRRCVCAQGQSRESCRRRFGKSIDHGRTRTASIWGTLGHLVGAASIGSSKVSCRTSDCAGHDIHSSKPLRVFERRRGGARGDHSNAPIWPKPAIAWVSATARWRHPLQKNRMRNRPVHQSKIE